MRKYKEPRVTISSKNSTCPETGHKILKGEQCYYIPEEKQAYHMDSEKAKNRFKWESNEIVTRGSLYFLIGY